jgi:hypothetical protein
VSKVGSPSRTHALGEVLVENRGPEGRIRPTPVSRHRGTGRAADQSAAPPAGVVPSCPLANQHPRLELTVPLRSG